VSALKRERGVNHPASVCISATEDVSRKHTGGRRRRRRRRRWRRSEKRVPATKAARRQCTIACWEKGCVELDSTLKTQRRRRVCCTRRIKGASEREEPLMLIKFNFPLIVKKMTTTAAGDEASALTERSERATTYLWRQTQNNSKRSWFENRRGEPRREPSSLSLAFLIRHCRPTQLAFAYLNLDFCTGCAWLAGFLGLDATTRQF